MIWWSKHHIYDIFGYAGWWWWNVSDNDNKDDDNSNSTNKSSCSRQPCRQGSVSESIERTAWVLLFVSSCPTVVHWLSGWYSSTWQIKMISFYYHHPIASPPFQPYKVIFKESPQISRKSHQNRPSASSYLLWLRHDPRAVSLASRQVETMTMLHEGGWAQKRGRFWIHQYPRQRWMPGNVKSLVRQVSPWGREEQHRRGRICLLAIGEVPRQSHWHCTCGKINADDVSIDDVILMQWNQTYYNLIIVVWKKFWSWINSVVIGYHCC